MPSPSSAPSPLHSNPWRAPATIVRLQPRCLAARLQAAAPPSVAVRLQENFASINTRSERVHSIPGKPMAALLNPTVRRLALAACRLHSTPAASVAAAAEPLVPHWTSQARYNSLVEVDDGGFGEMVAAGSPRYYVVGGKGGVGKTSMAASLPVKFANHGEPTLIISTVPHSLAGSFEQDMGGGKIVPVSGIDSLFATEIGHTKEEPFSHLFWIRGISSRTKLGAIVDPDQTNWYTRLITKDDRFWICTGAKQISQASAWEKFSSTPFWHSRWDPNIRIQHNGERLIG